MSNRDLLLLLEDMLESALKIKTYTKNISYDSFLENSVHDGATWRSHPSDGLLI